MNTDNSAMVRYRLANVIAALRLHLACSIRRLNARIDSQPLPRQHRMGAWERSAKDGGALVEYGEKPHAHPGPPASARLSGAQGAQDPQDAPVSAVATRIGAAKLRK